MSDEYNSQISEQNQNFDEDVTLKLIKSFKNKKSRLGADPSVISYFEASDYAAATSAALESSKERKDYEKKHLNEKLKLTPVRLTLSFYDGADHRFCVDFKRGDLIIDVLSKCRLEYGPLRGVLVEDLLLIKENLILPGSKNLLRLVKLFF